MAAKFEVSSAKHAFVSYVAEDKVRVNKLCRVLDAANVSYWRDRKALGSRRRVEADNSRSHRFGGDGLPGVLLGSVSRQAKKLYE
jgi:hypothetical protein